MNRFSKDEIVTVIGVVVCMVEALVVAIFLFGFIGDHVGLFFDFGYSTGLEGFSLTLANKCDRVSSTRCSVIPGLFLLVN